MFHCDWCDKDKQDSELHDTNGRRCICKPCAIEIPDYAENDET